MENKIIMSPNKESLADLKSAFSCLGWEMLSSSYERNSGCKHSWNMYVSLKKGNRTVRFSGWTFGKHVRITGIDKLLLHIGEYEAILDVAVFDDHYCKLSEKHKAMIDCKKGFAFKKQLLIPYVQGTLEELGLTKIKVSDSGNKHFWLSGSIKVGFNNININLTSVQEKYAELVDKEFDDYLFDFTSKYFSGRVKFSEVITIITNFNSVKTKLDIEYKSRVERFEDKSKEVSEASNALYKLKADLHSLQLNLNQYDTDFSNHLRKIINGAQAEK